MNPNSPSLQNKSTSASVLSTFDQSHVSSVAVNDSESVSTTSLLSPFDSSHPSTSPSDSLLLLDAAGEHRSKLALECPSDPKLTASRRGRAGDSHLQPTPSAFPSPSSPLSFSCAHRGHLPRPHHTDTLDKHDSNGSRPSQQGEAKHPSCRDQACLPHFHRDLPAQLGQGTLFGLISRLV